MKRFIEILLSFATAVIVSSALFTTPVLAADCGAGDGASFLEAFPTWHEYLVKDGDCQIDPDQFNFPGDLWKVALAIVAMLLRLAGLVAVGYTIYGGFKYVLSRGNPSEAAKARQTIIDALIGIAIASIAIVLVAFLGRTITRQ